MSLLIGPAEKFPLFSNAIFNSETGLGMWRVQKGFKVSLPRYDIAIAFKFGESRAVVIFK